MKKRFLAGTMAFCISLTLLSPVAFAEDGEEQVAMESYYSDITDIIGPTSTPDTGTGEGDGGQDAQVTVPDTSKFQSNEEFKPYDPWYPKKDQYGNYTLKIPDLKGRLTFSIGDRNQLVGTLYAPGVSRDGGWQDATKLWGPYDSGLCFAASSSNLIAWYLNRYTQQHPEDTNVYELNPEQVFNHFRNGWDPDLGGNQKEALSWYFTGGFPSGNPDPFNNHLNGKELGGYLHNKIPNNTSERWSELSLFWEPAEIFSVFGGYSDEQFPYIEDVGGMTGSGAFSTLEGFSEQIIRQLHYGACTISIVGDQTSGGSGHAITLWGVDYDVDTGLVTAIHVTDSDDKSGIFTVKTVRGDNTGGVRMVSYPYHPPVGTATRFTRIRDSIVLYAPDVVQSGQGPDVPTVPDEITSNKYPIDANKNITGIQPNATLESILPDLSGQNIKAFDAKGNPVAAQAPLGTGYVLTTGEDVNAPHKLTVVVSGDVNGDAVVDMRDMLLMQQARLQLKTLEGAFKKAATFKSDSETGPMQSDADGLKQFLVKIVDQL